MNHIDTQEKHVDIKDLIDIRLLQKLQDTFARAMGVAAVTVDRNGIPITESSNFCNVCTMIRSTERGLARCQSCDAEGGRIAHDRQRPYAYKCAGGFLDAAAPIIIDGEYVGCILCGQVIPSDASEEFIQDILDTNTPLGLPADKLEEELRKIEPLSRDRFKAAVEVLSLTAHNIMAKGAANLAQAQLLREAQERAALQVALQDAQMKALKAQINPHFLFNSLTLLSYTALDENAPRTEEIAYSLSDLLRYSLRNISTLVGVGEELAMVEHYLAIQKIRFGDRLQSQITVEPDLEQVEIPCMVLQPLVENAIIHGTEPVSRPVSIRINAYRHDDSLVLEVADDGVGMSADMVNQIRAGTFTKTGNSLGLQNVFQRLEGEYGHRFTVNVESAVNMGARFILSMPLQTDGRPAIDVRLEDIRLEDTLPLGNQIALDDLNLQPPTPVHHSVPVA
jgi:ligand-binding sensor protein/anti-sigma regulatory factor (Ser/Thr protein kinase)